MLFSPVHLVRNVPHVLLLIKYFDIIHVVPCVYLRLNPEKITRVSDVFSQLFRHIAARFEKLRVDLLKSLCDWIFIIHYVIIHSAVICVYDDFDRVLYIIISAHKSAVRFGVWIMAACGKSVDYPVKLAVCRYAVRIVLILDVREYVSYTLYDVSVFKYPGTAVDICGYKKLKALLS